MLEYTSRARQEREHSAEANSPVSCFVRGQRVGLRGANLRQVAENYFISLAKALQPQLVRAVLLDSRVTAIPRFASWGLPNRKTAPASARSRSNLKQG